MNIKTFFKRFIKYITLFWFIYYLFFINNNIINIYADKNTDDIFIRKIEKIPEQKRKEILEKEKVKNYLDRSISRTKVDRYLINNKYLDNTKPIIYIDEEQNITIKYNKYSHFNTYIQNQNRNYLREVLVEMLVKKYPEILDWELEKFILDIDNEGKLLITTKSKFNNTNKNINLDEYISEITTPTSTYNNLKSISTSHIVNTYYNILYDNIWEKRNNLISSFKFNLKEIKNSIIFKNEQDVKNLLDVNSYRIRDKFKWDYWYRKFNINLIYNTFKDNIKILNPWKTVSYNDIFNLWDKKGEKYKYWTAIVWNKEEKVYGWGVCGWTTWFLQGALWNANLDLKFRNHSWWYWYLYNANIDWKYITTPWLDATYYGWVVDMKITNIWKYPVFLINKVNKAEIEKNFTLWFKWDIKKADLRFIKKSWKCYYWKRDDKTITSCYKHIK